MGRSSYWIEWEELRVHGKAITAGAHSSTKELKNVITVYINNHNKDPMSFVWHKTTGQILDSIVRLCVRTLETRTLAMHARYLQAAVYASAAGSFEVAACAN